MTDFLLVVSTIVIFSSLSRQVIQTNDQTLPIAVLLGKPLIIKCRKDQTSDVRDIKLQWSKDMFGLESGTLAEVYRNRLFVPTSTLSGIFDLHFKYTELDDQGLYGCHIDITLSNGTLINIVEKFFLRIIDPPRTLKIKPKIQSPKESSFLWLPNEKIIWILQNRNLILNCTGKSQPATKILWKITSMYGTQELYNVQSDQSVVIKSSVKYHNSIVSCFIRNKEDYLGAMLPSVNYTIRVLYISKPKIVSEDKTHGDVIENEMMLYVCGAQTPQEANLFYSWYIAYPKASSVDQYLVNDSTSNSLSMTPTQQHHHGRLHCIIRGTLNLNDCDRSSNIDCELRLAKDVANISPFNVLYPPKIDKPFESITVERVGEWVTLVCNTDSNPSTSNKWFKTSIGTSKTARSINWYQQTKISSLVENLRMENMIYGGSYHKFQILNDQDLDIYICEAKSTIFATVYKYVIVAKPEATTIATDRSVIMVPEGGSASLLCLVEGWPRPIPDNIKWHMSDSNTPLIFNDRMYVANKKQLMALESKLYFKNVIFSDYGSYNCSISSETKTVSRKIDLKPIRDPLFIFTIIGIIGVIFVIATMIIIVCISRKLHNQKKKRTGKVATNGYGAPIQTSIKPSSTIESNLENEIFFNKRNSTQNYPKQNCFREMFDANSNSSFLVNAKPKMRRVSSGDSGTGPYDSTNSKVPDRSWDSGVFPDGATYHTNRIIQNHRGPRCISPFSAHASSNNSIGPLHRNSRFWPPNPPQEVPNQTTNETASNGFSGTDQGSNYNDSIHSYFIPPSIDGSRAMIASTGNQSFVCIPIEEYQHHMRLFQESHGEPSVHSFSSVPFTNNADVLASNHDCRLFNGICPTVANPNNSTSKL